MFSRITNGRIRLKGTNRKKNRKSDSRSQALRRIEQNRRPSSEGCLNYMLFAQTTLRLTTSITSSSLNVVTTRSFSNAFYYSTAIIWLMLLIFYIHQANGHNSELMKSMGGQKQQQNSLATSTRLNASHKFNRNNTLEFSGRSTRPGNSIKGGKTMISDASNSISYNRPTPMRDNLPRGYLTPAKAEPSSKRPTLPELSFRQADSYSEINRGSVLRSTGSGHQNDTTSHWRPIVGSSSQPTQQDSPATRRAKPKVVQKNNLQPASSLIHETTNEYRNQMNHLHNQHHRLRHIPYNSEMDYPMGVGGGGSAGRSWRRPRLNYNDETRPFRLSKMYKRVLICEKTLVSLDYLRDFASEPRPYHHFDEKFDDNIIDLDLKPDPSSLLISRRMGSSSSMNNSTSIDGLRDQESSSSNEIMDATRRYSMNQLPDEDALVKCDMWDLEKGLKNRKPPIEILEMAVKADFDTVRDAINRCRQLSEKTLPPDDEYRDGLEIMSTEDLVSLFSMKRGLIPGTKWCGLGDQASAYNDLGPKHRIDICCRAHDHCPIRLKPFRNDYGVLNIALYTKSHCDCDADFYRCLREAHSRTADMLGNLYFNVMKLQCIREARLKVCREMRPIALGFERCVRYEESPMKRVFKFTTPPVAY